MNEEKPPSEQERPEEELLEQLPPPRQQPPAPEDQPCPEEGDAPAVGALSHHTNHGSYLPRAEGLGPSEAGKRTFHSAQGPQQFIPTRSPERTRGALAVWAMALFSVMVIALTLPVIAGWRKWGELQGLAASVLPVVVSVVATIVGFYFGIKSATENGTRASREHQCIAFEEEP
jgi:hypothetical protein